MRCLAIDDEGRVTATATAAYPLHSPHPGWAEQDPEDWWSASRAVIAKVAEEVGGELQGIGLAGQMHGAIFLDRHDEVIRPALLWNDQRTAAQCQAITDRVGPERLNQITGNPALTGFQAPKILWLRDEEPEAFAKIATILLPKDFIRLRLSGERATDVSDASGTLLLDLKTRSWSAEILDALEIERQWLPPVFESCAQAGEVSRDVASKVGLAPGIRLAAGGGDNAAAAVGNGVVRPGLASCSIGTSGVFFAHADTLTPDPSGRLHTFCHAVPDRYHQMGVTLSAGGALRWWRDVVGRGDYDELNELAKSAPPGAEGLLFLPYLTGERTPHMDPRARAMFVGLSSRHGLAHMSRAVFEGVAFSLRDSFEIMKELGLDVAQIRITGGGARSPFWRQLLADVLGRSIVRTVADEGPAYGAALLAGVAAGVFRNVDEACGVVRLAVEHCEPDAGRARLYDDYYATYTRLYPATRKSMHELSGLAAPNPRATRE